MKLIKKPIFEYVKGIRLFIWELTKLSFSLMPFAMLALVILSVIDLVTNNGITINKIIEVIKTL